MGYLYIWVWLWMRSEAVVLDASRLTPDPHPPITTPDRPAQQAQHAPKPYIEHQRHLNAKMRAILLDWILDVHQSLGFRPQTLYRTAHILDQVGPLVCSCLLAPLCGVYVCVCISRRMGHTLTTESHLQPSRCHNSS